MIGRPLGSVRTPRDTEPAAIEDVALRGVPYTEQAEGALHHPPATMSTLCPRALRFHQPFPFFACFFFVRATAAARLGERAARIVTGALPPPPR